MPRGFSRIRRAATHEEISLSPPASPAVTGAPTHKVCAPCGASSAIQAQLCQTCGARFPSMGGFQPRSRLVRVRTRRRWVGAPEVEIDLVDDPVTDDLIARLDRAMAAEDRP